MAVKEIKVPDIGDFSDVPVIGIMVATGDTVEKEDPLIELESDKATMEVPSPAAGKILEIKVKEGDKVSKARLFSRSRWKVQVVEGVGTFESANVFVVETKDGVTKISFDQCIIAAGSEPVELPFNLGHPIHPPPYSVRDRQFRRRNVRRHDHRSDPAEEEGRAMISLSRRQLAFWPQ